MPPTHGVFYKTSMCKFHLLGRCMRSTSCNFAHSIEELRQPPDFSYTKMCQDFSSSGKCRWGDDCKFAHDFGELRTTCGPVARASRPEAEAGSSISPATPAYTFAVPADDSQECVYAPQVDFGHVSTKKPRGDPPAEGYLRQMPEGKSAGQMDRTCDGLGDLPSSVPVPVTATERLAFLRMERALGSAVSELGQPRGAHPAKLCPDLASGRGCRRGAACRFDHDLRKLGAPHGPAARSSRPEAAAGGSTSPAAPTYVSTVPDSGMRRPEPTTNGHDAAASHEDEEEEDPFGPCLHFERSFTERPARCSPTKGPLDQIERTQSGRDGALLSSVRTGATERTAFLPMARAMGFDTSVRSTFLDFRLQEPIGKSLRRTRSAEGCL